MISRSAILVLTDECDCYLGGIDSMYNSGHVGRGVGVNILRLGGIFQRDTSQLGNREKEIYSTGFCSLHVPTRPSRLFSQFVIPLTCKYYSYSSEFKRIDCRS